MYRSAARIVVFIVFILGSSAGQSPSELYVKATTEMRVNTVRILGSAAGLDRVETMPEKEILICNITDAPDIKDICSALKNISTSVYTVGLQKNHPTTNSMLTNFEDSIKFYKDKCRLLAHDLKDYHDDKFSISKLESDLSQITAKYINLFNTILRFKKLSNDDSKRTFLSSLNIEKINQSILLKTWLSQKEEKLWTAYKMKKSRKNIEEYINFFSGTLSPFGSHIKEADSIRSAIFYKELKQKSIKGLKEEYDKFTNFSEKNIIDSIAWQKTSQQKSTEDLRAYQFHFPSGRYYREAESKIQARKILNMALIILGIAIAVFAFSISLYYYSRKKSGNSLYQEDELPSPSIPEPIDPQLNIEPELVKVPQPIIEEIQLEPLPILAADTPALEEFNLKEFHYLGVPTFQGAFKKDNIKPGQNAESLFVLRLDKEKGKGYFSIQLTPKKLKQLHDQAFQSIEIAFEANCPYLFNSPPKVEIISEGTLLARDKRTWVIDQKLKLNFSSNDTK